MKSSGWGLDDEEVIKRNVRDYPWFSLGDFLWTLWAATLVFWMVIGILWGLILGAIYIWAEGVAFWEGFAAGIVGMILAGAASAGMNTRVYVRAYHEVKDELDEKGQE